MSAPQISVVLPVFNAQDFLEPLLDSLRHQSETSLEIIAVDDGSTDDSLAILQSAARRDPRLCVLQQLNKGISVARNTALGHARGRWIAFADGDDWMHPQMLSTWRTHAETNNLDFIVGNGFHFREEPVAAPREILLREQPWNEITSGAEWIVRSVAANEWPHFVWLQLVRRDFLEASSVSFVAGISHQDIVWTMQLALAAQRVGFCETPFYGYRTNAQSESRSPTEKAVQRRARSYLVVMRHLNAAANNAKYSDNVRRALAQHLNREGKHLLALMRKGVRERPAKRAIAREFFHLGLARAMWRGARTPQEQRRALRCNGLMRLCAHGLR